MQTEARSIEILGAVEEALVVQQPFGNSAYITGQLERTFKHRLELLAPTAPAAGRLLDAVEHADPDTRHRVAGNTVIRCSVQHAHTRLEAGSTTGLPAELCEAVWERTAEHIGQGRSGTPFENGRTHLERLGAQPFHGWIWSDDYPDDEFGRAFRFLLNQEYGAVLCTPTQAEIAMLRSGEALLRDLLPSLSVSALTHTHLVGCFPDVGFWRGKVSSSQIRMGGIVFLSRHILVNPWCVAEHLLHEGLHQKLYDFRHGHSLLDVEYSAATSPKVQTVWNAAELNQSNVWDTHRAFAAFHVYVQLGLLALVAEQRASELEGTYGPFRGMIDSRKALARAHYLGEKLTDVCWDQLGPAGRALCEWLKAVLHALNPTPPPHGAHVHLHLDLYLREANQVEAILQETATAAARFAPLLTPIVEDEIAAARQILTAVGADEQLTELERGLPPSDNGALGGEFPAVRRTIARALSGATPDGYSLRSHDGATDADTLVKELVESGSERLYLLRAGVPPAVAAAKARAREQRFTKSCDDEVGQLLAALAAAVPDGGRILEIGTGVGVGLAWIATGLGGRLDVDVLSIEAEPRLASSAAAWRWPESTRIMVDDARAILATLGTFDLVFADAAPVKYGDIAAVIDLLRPGGMLVIDDFHDGPTTTERERAEKAALRAALFSHGDLVACELSWSSGVVLATKRAAADPHELSSAALWRASRSSASANAGSGPVPGSRSMRAGSSVGNTRRAAAATNDRHTAV